MNVRPPAARPCGSCPYRVDVPSGVWDEEEYLKLPAYDAETGHQPIGVFLCHQRDGSVCAGWAHVHGDEHSLALRVAVAHDLMTLETLDAVIAYRTDVPVFATGREACAHGLEEVASPGAGARRVIRRLRRKGDGWRDTKPRTSS